MEIRHGVSFGIHGGYLPFSLPMHFFVFNSPLTEKLVLAALNGNHAHKLEDEISVNLLVPAEFHEGVDVTDWASIPTPPPPAPPAPAPALESAPAAASAPAPQA